MNPLKIMLAATALFASPAMAANLLSDGGFETQGAASTGNYCYFGFAAGGNPACGAGAWSGAVAPFGGSGLQIETNSAWPGLPTPDGRFYGFIQMTGRLSQIVNPSQSGSYLLNWLDAGRPQGCCGGNQHYAVFVDDGSGLSAPIYAGVTTTGQGWTARQSAPVTLTAGTSYTLTFRGLETQTDQTSFIDAVALSISAVPEPGSWALMLTGFGLMGGALRRRKRLDARHA